MASQREKGVVSKKETLWRAHISAWEKAGISQADYCRQYGLSPKSFTYWKGRLKPQVKGVSFYQIATTGHFAHRIGGQKIPGALNLLIGDRFCIEINDDFSPAVLRKLVHTLERL